MAIPADATTAQVEPWRSHRGRAEQWVFIWIFFMIEMPLVSCYIAIEHGPFRNRGFLDEKMVIVHSYVNVYQRVV